MPGWASDGGWHEISATASVGSIVDRFVLDGDCICSASFPKSCFEV